MRIDHLKPERNVICAAVTAVGAVALAHVFMQAGGTIPPDGTTCITAARAPSGLPVLSVDEIIVGVSALSVLPAYIWDCIMKYLTPKSL
jgi:hypothetical protein